MKPLVRQLADAVAAELTGGLSSGLAAPQVIYRPSDALKDLDQARLYVVPKAVDWAPQDRASDVLEMQVDVAIRRRVSPRDDDAIDELLALAQDIAAWLNRRKLADLPSAAFVSMTGNPIYDPVDLDHQHLFTAVWTITYRLPRSL